MSDSNLTLPNFDAVKTREDLVKFLDQLADRFPDDKLWDNRDLSSYLHGAAGFVSGLDGAYAATGDVFSEKQNYRLIAEIFWYASTYE